jgi:hypothetical protein
MNVLLYVLAAVLFWLGIDALRLSRHRLPPTQNQREAMMFGRRLHQPLPDQVRIFAEKYYPFATGQSMAIYGWLFIVGGMVSAWFAWNL